MSNRIYVRGDTHGSYDWLEKFCQDEQTDHSDILILLGDHALRFEGYNNRREVYRKEQVTKFPITIFGVFGNHDRPPRPDLQETHCPLTVQPMLHDEKYPNLWYFCENEFPVWEIYGKLFLVLQGAYSVDKEWRQLMHWTWYEDEQLAPELQNTILEELKKYQNNFKYDFVLTHTCPESWEPTDLFMKGVIDQSKVDCRTEKWLEEIKNTINFDNWYFGHYHDNREINDKATMLYEEVRRIV